jgi:EAL domain-containing protein (putative c-di-GMP-specific phosphodiesterase class I)
MEAHLRWFSPHGLLEPESFIEIARTTNLLDDLFFAILPAVAADCAAWRRNDDDVAVTIGLPVSLLSARDLPARLEDIVAMNGLPAGNVTLEVTVDAWLHENQIAREMLTRLRIRGFGLSVADFGTGYSTIKHLLDSPFNEMKIGRAFVRAAPTDPEAAIALDSCIALAHQLGMTAVAEGVETPAQLGFVTGAGCDQVLGPIVARPMPGDELARWMSMRGSELEIAGAA